MSPCPTRFLAEWIAEKGGAFPSKTICSVSFSSKNPRIDEHPQRSQTNRIPAIIPRMPALPEGDYDVSVRVDFPAEHEYSPPACEPRIHRRPSPWSRTEAQANVTLQRSSSRPTNDQALWAAIRNRTEAISFPRYQKFIDQVFGQSGATRCNGCADRPQCARAATRFDQQGSSRDHLKARTPTVFSSSPLRHSLHVWKSGVFPRSKSSSTPIREVARFDDPNISGRCV